MALSLDGTTGITSDGGTPVIENLDTTATGIDVTGTVTADVLTAGRAQFTTSGTPSSGAGVEITYGQEAANTGGILAYNRTAGTYQNIVYNAAAHIHSISGSEQMRLTSTGLGIGTSSPSARIDVSGDVTNPAGIFRKGGAYGNIESTDTNRTAKWTFGRDNAVTGNFVIALNDLTKASIDPAGNLLVGGTVATGNPTQGMQVLINSGASSIVIGHSNGTASGNEYAGFSYNATKIGSITQSGTTAVLYNTTSDYRLKDNPQPLTGSGVFIDALKPTTWEWTADGRTDAGFIAHEFQEVAPNSVTGVKDELNEDGTPKYQAMQASSAEVIANLVAEIQSLRQRLAAAGI